MSYIKITNGTQQPYNIGLLRRDNPNVSFPKTLSSELLARYDVYSVVYGDVPEYDPLTQTISTATTATQVDGVWTYVTTVQDKTGADLEDVVRTKRKGLLVETDHYGMSDMTMTDAMAAYRQALRDVPAQAGFPTTISWPTLPGDS